MKIILLIITVACLNVAVTQDLDDVSFEDEEEETNHSDIDNETSKESFTKIRYPQNEEEKQELIKKAMVAAFKRPGAWGRLGQVLPIVRLMSPPQRLALASLVMAQVLASPNDPLPPVSKSENITSQLMLPIAVDIATMFRGLGRETQETNEGRSNSYTASGLFQGNRITTATGPNIRRPPPTINGINRRNANVHIDKLPALKRRIPRPGMRKPGSTAMTPSQHCTLLTNNLCIETQDYPEEAILKSIKSDRNPGAFHALLKEPKPENASEHDSTILERRQGEAAEPSKRHMCETTLEFARPKKARATSGQWKYIVNTGDYTQTLRLELCSKPMSPCTFLAEDVNSQCVQIYNYHRLLTWDETNGLTMDVFKVPTCCSCRILGYGGLPFPRSTESPNLSTPLGDLPDSNLVGNDDPPAVVRLPPPPPPPPPSPPSSSLPPKGIRVRPYSPPKRRPGLVQHRGPPLPLEGEGSKEDFRYPPYDNTLRRITRNNTVDRVKFKPHLLPPPTPNQRHPALPMDTIHSDTMSISNISPTPTAPATTPSKRVNYSYHPIIDYFRPQIQEAESRVGLDWTPIVDHPRTMSKPRN